MALTFCTIDLKSSQLSGLLFGSKALFSIYDVLASIFSTKRNKACRHHLTVIYVRCSSCLTYIKSSCVEGKIVPLSTSLPLQAGMLKSNNCIK